MVFKPDSRPQEKLTTNAEQYRDSARRLRELIDFKTKGGNFDTVHPGTALQHRETTASLARSAGLAEYNGMSQYEVALALIKRFEDKATAADKVELGNKPIKELATIQVTERKKVFLPREQDSIVDLPGLDNKRWEIIRVNVGDQTYVLADPNDRRAVSDIISDVRSNRLKGNQKVGYEVSWDELEGLAESMAA